MSWKKLFNAASYNWLQVVSDFDTSIYQAIQKNLDVLEDNSIAHKLAFMKTHFEEIPKFITRFETVWLDLCTAVCQLKITKRSTWPGKAGGALKTKSVSVLHRNPEWKFLKDFERRALWCTLHGIFTAKISCLKYLPIVSCDVELAFSGLKMISSDRRKSFKLENLEKSIIAKLNKFD